MRDRPQYAVTVYPESNSDYVSQFYAGLFDLQATGTVALRFGRCPPRQDRSTDIQGILRLDVATAAAPRPMRVCFDSSDWQDIASMDDLVACDVYFKRGYRPAYIEQLDAALRDKISPLGLHYGCMSRNEFLIDSFSQVLARHSNTGAFSRTPIRAIAQLFASPAKRLMKRYGYARFENSLPFMDAFEVAPDVPAEQLIFYRTRVYGPKDAPVTNRSGRLDEINNLRVGTIRALRNQFGDRFVGGLRPSPYARETYPDCLFPDDPGLRGHLELSKTCLINVNTAGLHDSTSWKMPEYMAGSRCIVSEPLVYEVPVPLVERTHYLAFQTPEECVRACQELLDDPALAGAMRKANFHYYAQHVRPAQLMLHSLATVFKLDAEPQLLREDV